MNSTTISAHHSSNLQLFPVCVFLGITFYKSYLIPLGEDSMRHLEVFTFFEYLNNFDNEFEMKNQFLQKMLKESRPSKVEDYEIPDTKNVDKRYQYIIKTSISKANRIYIRGEPVNSLTIEVFNRAKNEIIKFSQNFNKNNQHFPLNYIDKSPCLLGISVKLNFFVTESMYKNYISPIFQEKNIIGNSQMARKLKIPCSLDETLYNSWTMALKQFCEKGISGIRKDQVLLNRVRRSVEVINNCQITVLEKQKTENEKQKDMYFTEIISKKGFVEVFKNLKRKKDVFYFNDITLLTDINFDYGNIYRKKSKYSSGHTNVLYHIKFTSQHRLVNLTAFNDRFKNQYIVFPEIDFLVTDVISFHGILQIELEEKPTTIDEWKSIRRDKYMSLNNKEKSKRMKIIENAAYLISLNENFKRIYNIEKYLRLFILNIDSGCINSVPSYNMLAWDIQQENIIFPSKYLHYLMNNTNIVIDDVLFNKKNTLYPVNYLNDEIIMIMYVSRESTDLMVIEHVFKKYLNESKIKYIINFWQYYFIYKVLYKKETNYNYVRAYNAAIYTQALRQCDEKFINDETILYRAEYIPINDFLILSDFVNGELLSYQETFELYYTKEEALENCLFSKNSSVGKLIIHKVKIKNQAVLLDFNRILNKDLETKYLLPQVIELKKYSMEPISIEGKDEDAIELIEYEDDDTPKEKIMVKLANLIDVHLNVDHPTRIL
ncbi:uncharacterized protein LOC127285574 [Leptopilina boulardi]|uniref:uncharacterized protein LOC127285574 n=1 Tax=Leptopilina boulardi TaxID=63433 RepID=UPI0021F690EE|nr:uncharacterized protein LOC127285574 [Leptopilina boulardi]